MSIEYVNTNKNKNNPNNKYLYLIIIFLLFAVVFFVFFTVKLKIDLATKNGTQQISARPVGANQTYPEINIDVSSGGFLPSSVSVVAGNTYTFVIHNTDNNLTHSFSLPSNDINLILGPGESKNVNVTVVQKQYFLSSIYTGDANGFKNIKGEINIVTQ